MEEVRKALWVWPKNKCRSLARDVELELGIPPDFAGSGGEALEYLSQQTPIVVFSDDIVPALGLTLPPDVSLSDVHNVTRYFVREVRARHDRLPLIVGYCGGVDDSDRYILMRGEVKGPRDFITAGATGIIDHSEYAVADHRFVARVREILDTTRDSSRT